MSTYRTLIESPAVLQAGFRARPTGDGSMAAAADATTVLRTVWRRVLRLPLIGKLLGANLLIAVTALGVSGALGDPGALALVSLALGISFAINMFLVRLALSPLDELERTAERVSGGEWYMRVARSAIADRRIERLGDTLNRLLERVQADRRHIHELIQRSLGLREAERAAWSRQLRETSTQQLAALMLQLAAVDRSFGSSEGRSALHAARTIAATVTDELRGVADAVYPGLLHEMGLSRVLAALAARAGTRSGMQINVEVPKEVVRLAPALETALYFVADEAVRNAERHAHARLLWIGLTTGDGHVRLEVVDDGVGFNAAAAELANRGVGLFQARELLAHVHGEMQILSAPGHGTRVIASANLDQGVTS